MRYAVKSKKKVLLYRAHKNEYDRAMFVLIIDTTSACLTAAVADEHKVLAEHQQVLARGQGEQLIGILQGVLDKAGKKLQDMQAIVVNVGPGSFTGVRIGLATARALGLALQIPVWGVTAFEAYAYGAQQPLAVVLESLRDDVYIQNFNGQGQATDEPHVCAAENVPVTALRGSAAERVAQVTNAPIVPMPCSLAQAMAQIAFARQKEPLSPHPMYVRDADVSLV